MEIRQVISPFAEFVLLVVLPLHLNGSVDKHSLDKDSRGFANTAFSPQGASNDGATACHQRVCHACTSGLVPLGVVAEAAASWEPSGRAICLESGLAERMRDPGATTSGLNRPECWGGPRLLCAATSSGLLA